MRGRLQIIRKADNREYTVFEHIYIVIHNHKYSYEDFEEINPPKYKFSPLPFKKTHPVLIMNTGTCNRYI